MKEENINHIQSLSLNGFFPSMPYTTVTTDVIVRPVTDDSRISKPSPRPPASISDDIIFKRNGLPGRFD